MVIYLERGADLHMAQRIPLPLTVSCFSKIQICFSFLVPAHPGSPEQRAVKLVCVCAHTDRHRKIQTEDTINQLSRLQCNTLRRPLLLVRNTCCRNAVVVLTRQVHEAARSDVVRRSDLWLRVDVPCQRGRRGRQMKDLVNWLDKDWELVNTRRTW